MSFHFMNRLAQGETAYVASETSVDNSNRVWFLLFNAENIKLHVILGDSLLYIGFLSSPLKMGFFSEPP